jgi:hypothetical protein
MGYNSRYNPSQGGRNPTRDSVIRPASRPLPPDTPEAASTGSTTSTTPEQLRQISLQSAATGLPSPDLAALQFSKVGY